MSDRTSVPHRNPAVRAAAFLSGLVFLGLGVTGFFLPGLPGTPLLLVAAWLFSLSNDRLYRWMMTNRWFGQIVADYRSGFGIPRRIKRIAITMVVIAIAISAVFALDVWWHRLLLVAVGAYGIWFIRTRPTTEDVLRAQTDSV